MIVLSSMAQPAIMLACAAPVIESGSIIATVPASPDCLSRNRNILIPLKRWTMVTTCGATARWSGITVTLAGGVETPRIGLRRG